MKVTSWHHSIRRVERFILKLITLRRNFPCDSHVRLCYICILLRQKIRRDKSDRWAINTKTGCYIFKNSPKVRCVARFPKSDPDWLPKVAKWLKRDTFH